MSEELKIKVTAEVSQADNNLKQIDSTVKNTEKDFQKFIDSLDDTEKASKDVSSSFKGDLAPSLGSIAKGALAGTVAFVGLNKALEGMKVVINQAALVESLKTRLVSLYQSTDKATEVFDKFKKIAETTPFNLTEVVEAGSTLKAFGLNAEQTLKSVTDLAAYMGLSVTDAASAVGRAFAAGAGAADILRERGVLKLIASFKGIEDITTLTLPEFREAMLSTFVDPAAGISGSTDRLSATFNGALSNMGDAWDNLKNVLGTAAIPVINTSLIDLAEGSVRRLTSTINSLAGVLENPTMMTQELGSNLASTNTEAVKAASQFNFLSSQLLILSKNTNLTTYEEEQRKKIIDELNSDYSMYLSNLITESDNYLDLSKNIDTAKTSLEEYYKIKSQQAVAKDLEAQIEQLSKVNAQLEYAYKLQGEFESGATESLGAVVKGADGSYMSFQRLGETIEENKKKLEDLHETLRGMTSTTSEIQSSFVIRIDEEKAAKNVSDVIKNINLQPIEFETKFKTPEMTALQIPVVYEPEDMPLIPQPPDIVIRAISEFDETIANIGKLADAGLDVTDKTRAAFETLFADLEAMSMQDSETYAYYQGLKTQADEAYLEQKKALLEEDAALMLNYYDIAGNAASQFAEGLIMRDLSWKKIREGVYRSLITSTVKYFADMAKQYLLDQIVRKSIEKAGMAASIASAVGTGKAVASAYATPAALANTATFGAASIAGTAGIATSIGIVKGLANAATGAYIDDSGKIHGAGTGTSDSILSVTEQGQPLMVSNGEMIIKEAGVKEYYPILNAINNDTLPKLATGGIINNSSNFDSSTSSLMQYDTTNISNVNSGPVTSQVVVNNAKLIDKIDELIRVQKETRNATNKRPQINIINRTADIRTEIDNSEYERSNLIRAGYDY